MHTTHSSTSQSRGGSHVSHEDSARAMQLEIDRLKRKLCHERRKRTPSISDPSFDDDGDRSYRPRLRTPPSESFSTSSHLDRVEKHSKRHSESSFPKSIGNDAMIKALRQSKSPFVRRID